MKVDAQTVALAIAHSHLDDARLSLSRLVTELHLVRQIRRRRPIEQRDAERSTDALLALVDDSLASVRSAIRSCEQALAAADSIGPGNRCGARAFRRG